MTKTDLAKLRAAKRALDRGETDRAAGLIDDLLALEAGRVGRAAARAAGRQRYMRWLRADTRRRNGLACTSCGTAADAQQPRRMHTAGYCSACGSSAPVGARP